MDVVVRDNNIGMERCRRTIDPVNGAIGNIDPMEAWRRPFLLCIVMPGSHCHRRCLVTLTLEGPATSIMTREWPSSKHAKARAMPGSHTRRALVVAIAVVVALSASCNNMET